MAGILQVLPLRKSKNNVLECHKKKSMPRGKRKDLLVAERWQRGSSSAATAVWRWWQCSCSAAAGSVAAVLAAQQWQHWQHASGGRLGGCGGSLAALQHQRRQQSGGSCATAAPRHSGNEDTGSDSNGRVTTNNQQSTKCGSGNGNGNNDNNDT
jgi:hypothetical protein